MTTLDLIGHGAYLSLIAGMALIARGRRGGWALRVIGDATWVVLGAVLGLTSVAIWGLMFTLLDIAAWLGCPEKKNPR